MHNKPKFNLFNNITYAMAGMHEVLRSETSFKVQLAVIVVLGAILFFLPLATLSKMIMFTSMFLVSIAEVTNSAIERVVDLVTQEYHELAKQAKDIGAFLVLLAFIFVVMIWGIVLYWEMVLR